MSSVTRSPLRVIGVGASAGGIQPLIELLATLPADFPHAVCVTVHISASAESLLPEILDRRCALTVTAAGHGARLDAGHVFVAPPDRHLLVADGRIELSWGPKENGARPAVDVMLRSIARHGARGVAVVLSGALGDGSNGARLVLQAGGAVFVQDPSDAAVPSMPERALELVGGDARVLTAREIGPALAALEPGNGEGKEPDVDLPGVNDRAHGARPGGPAGDGGRDAISVATAPE